MAPRPADRAEEQTDAPAGLPDLLALLTSGATFGGIPVRTLRIELADGRVQRIELPAAAVTADTPMKRAVRQAVDELLVGDVVSYEKLAQLTGYSNSGKFREFVKEYAEQSSRLTPHRQGWEKVR
jgi:hypothetical protein